MLQHIHITNLAIGSNLEIDLRHWMTALTGETGAGKSILVDALGFALGDRADNNMIQHGADRAEITAIFSLQGLPHIVDWLKSHEFDSDDECHLRRLINRNGNSRAYINGTPAPLKTVQKLGSLLVDIHGQHAHHSLLHREHQRYLLDDYADLLPLCNKVADQYIQWKDAEAELQRLSLESGERLERVDLLKFQTDELKTLALGDDELCKLEIEFKQLSNAERILQSCARVLELVDDEEKGALHQLHQCTAELNDLAAIIPDLKESHELLESAAIQIQEASSSIGGFNQDLELDPNRLNVLDLRLGEIHAYARKYRCKPEQLNQHLETLECELDQLQNADIHLATLQQQVSEQKAVYLTLAHTLSKKRLKAAKLLSKQVTDGMNSLGMSEGKFVIKLDLIEESKAAASGIDRVGFLVSANPGHTPQPLAKVASGGELSRISLAIQVATISCRQVPTLIFDEVDVGIGGSVAETVGRLLSRLGQTRQVLCVTHLPQVASQSHNHLLVKKTSSAKTTRSELNHLTETERVKEIARMLGGLEITGQTIAHAQEMIERSVAAST